MTRIKNSKGFTLIELIVVIVIIGILAAIAAVAYNAFIAGAQETSVEANANQLAKVITGAQAQAQSGTEVAALGSFATPATDFAAGTLQFKDNTGAFVDANPTLLGDLNAALGASTVYTATDGTITLLNADKTYECVITLSATNIGGFSPICGTV